MNKSYTILLLFLVCLNGQSQIPDSLHFEWVQTENNPNFEYVTDFNYDASGNLWISSLRGLFKFDGYKTDLYVHDPNDTLSLINNRIFSTYLSQDGSFWICASRGIQLYDKQNDVFELRMKAYNQSVKDIYNISFNCALDLDKDRLLLGFKKGLLIYNKATDKVEKIDELTDTNERDSYSYSSHVLKMAEDNIDSDIVWLLTRTGLFKYSKSERRAEQISNDLNIDFLYNKDRGYDIKILGNEVLILSNYFHVYSYHKLNKEWSEVSKSMNQTNTKEKKYIRNIVGVGDEYALVVYIEHGIKRYVSESKTLAKVATKFDDGLKVDKLSYGIIDANGYLLFVNGNEKFIKSHRKLMPKLRNPVFSMSDLKINDQKISNSSFFEEQLVLQNYERDIRFKLGITYPDFDVPVDYYYTLDNRGQDWVEINRDREVHLSDLSPGQYTLFGKALYGETTLEQDILSFKIQPYFYETWWFKCITALIVGLLGYVFYWQYKSRQLEKKEFDATLLDFQMNALRSQMNPHFLFNSLNSIKNYMVNKGPDEAADYLTRFSLLIRKILENSRKKLLTLEEEIEMLDLYIEMENKRFSEKFSYRMEIDDSIDQSYFFVAPMIIQPYIENAIWHGLMNKQEDRNLSVRFLPSGEDVICYIVDNGIGRVEARKRKRNQNSSKKSLGMEITGDHIEAINKLYQINAKVDIEDCYDQKGNPTGTKVKIFLPRLHKKIG